MMDGTIHSNFVIDYVNQTMNNEHDNKNIIFFCFLHTNMTHYIQHSIESWLTFFNVNKRFKTSSQIEYDIISFSNLKSFHEFASHNKNGNTIKFIHFSTNFSFMYNTFHISRFVSLNYWSRQCFVSHSINHFKVWVLFFWFRWSDI